MSVPDADPRPWLMPGWRDGAVAWARDRLAAQGRVISGEVTQAHVRAWSTVLHLPATGGAVYFKASGPCQAFEVALTTHLASVAPTRLPGIIGADPCRGWLLLEDGGPTARSTWGDAPDLGVLCEALGAYAALQRATTDGAVRATGLHDFATSTIADRFGAFVENLPRSLPGFDVPEAVREGAAGAVPGLERLAAALQACPTGDAVQHNDLHDANLLIRDGECRLFDWGDACFGHPFATLFVFLRGLAGRWQVAPDEARIVRLRDAYLEPWGDVAPPDALRRACGQAWALGAVHRALTWGTIAPRLHPDDRGVALAPLAHWLAEVPAAVAAGSPWRD